MNLSPIEIPAKLSDIRFEVPTVDGGDFTYDVGHDAGTIRIFDAIGGDVTPARISAALRAIGAKPVTIIMNSPGGSYFDGVAIFNLLRSHSHPVTAQIVGVAASAASLICMAAQRIEMARNAAMMIHEPWGVVAGNATELEATAKVLRKLAEAMADTYAARTRQPRSVVRFMLAEETWLDTDEALSRGFADVVLDRDADPRPRTVQNSQPRNKRDLEAQLRHLGFAKAAAERVASAGWAALQKTPDTADLQLRLKAGLDDLIQLAKGT